MTNASANASMQVVNAISQLALVYFLTQIWSTKEYNDWILIFTIPSYISMLNISMGNAFGNRATQALSAGDLNKTRITLNTGFLVLIILSIGILLLGLCLVRFVDFKSLMNLHTIGTDTSKVAVLLCFIYSIPSLAQAYQLAVLRTIGFYYSGVNAITIAKLLETLLIILFSITGKSIIEILICIVLVKVGVVCVSFYYIKRKTNLELVGLRFAEIDELRKTVPISGLSFLFPLGNLISIQGVIVLVSNLLGEKAVVLLNVIRIVTRSMVQFCSIIRNALMPELSRLSGAGRGKDAIKYSFYSIKVTSIFVAFFTIILILIGQSFIKVWSNGMIIVDQHILVLFTFAAALSAIWWSVASYMIGLNKYSGVAKFYFCLSVLFIIFASLTLDVLGLAGLGTLLVLLEGTMLIYTSLKLNSLNNKINYN